MLAAQAARAFVHGLGSVVIGVSLEHAGRSATQVGVILACLLAGAALVSVLLARYGRPGRTTPLVLPPPRRDGRRGRRLRADDVDTGLFALDSFGRGLGVPVIAGALKSLYDLGLWAIFRQVDPKTESAAAA